MKSRGKDYIVALVTVAVMAGICFPFSPLIGYQAVGLIFLGIIALLSLVLGRGALLFAALLNFAIWNFFFIPPLFTFRVHSFHDIVSLFTYLLIAVVGITFISRIRKSQLTLQKSQDRIITLNTLLESLNNATSIKEVVRRLQDSFRMYFSAEVVIYLKQKRGSGLDPRPFGSSELHDPEAFDSAMNVFININMDEDYLFPSGFTAELQFLPLSEPRKKIGVIGIRFNEGKLQDRDKTELLRTFLGLAASALDREISIDAAKEKEISAETEKLFQTVLRSVSHELRTPISVIRSAVSNLNDEKTFSKMENRRQICEELDKASSRLNWIVENILDMSRIDSGHLKLNLQYCDITDLFGIVAREMKPELENHRLVVSVDENLPMIQADVNLLKHAMVNIIHNSVLYSPKGTSIQLNAQQGKDHYLEIGITDHGNGIQEQFIDRLFDKFFRVPGSESGGTGLGLTISKAIIEMHGGTILPSNTPGGGLKMTINLKAASENDINRE